MKKILILGSSGLIGHQIYKQLEKLDKYKVLGVSRKNKFPEGSILLDVLNQSALESLLITESPDIVINCVGMLISDSEEHPELASSLNAELPIKLDKISKQLNFKLIHITTDCVFSGLKGTSYVETDKPDATHHYGLTKSLGEIISGSNLVIRTSVIGPEITDRNEELFNWFFFSKGQIEGYETAIWSGVTTLELSKKIDEFISLGINGLYHLTNNQSISKYHLLVLLKKHLKKEIKIIPVNKNNLDKSFIDSRTLISGVPSYEEMIKEMVKEISSTVSTYAHYK